MIDVNNLMLGWRAFTKVYVKKGTLLYDIKYNGYKPFSIEYRAPQDGFYVHNGSCLDHARWFDWGHTDKEPILCEFWDSKEEFESRAKKQVVPPKYGTGYKDEIISRIIDDKKEEAPEPCYTYLMKDDTNGYYKIGMSKDATYRERTLQAEKPTISLLNKKSFTTREEARRLEKQLHQTFERKRIRGEWFCLSEADVMYVKKILE
jgi:hypothetical protein